MKYILGIIHSQSLIYYMCYISLQVKDTENITVYELFNTTVRHHTYHFAITDSFSLSDALNSECICVYRKGSMKSENTSSILCDSDSEEDLTRKVACKRRFSESLPDDDRTEEVSWRSRLSLYVYWPDARQM